MTVAEVLIRALKPKSGHSWLRLRKQFVKGRRHVRMCAKR